MTFTTTACLLQASSTKRPQEIGKCRDDLYFLCSRCMINSNPKRTIDASCFPVLIMYLKILFLFLIHVFYIHMYLVPIHIIKMSTLFWIQFWFQRIINIYCGTIGLVIYLLRKWEPYSLYLQPLKPNNYFYVQDVLCLGTTDYSSTKALLNSLNCLNSYMWIFGDLTTLPLMITKSISLP